MPRYKVSYEIEIEEHKFSNTGGSYLVAHSDSIAFRVPPDAVIEEIKPPFVPGYYTRADAGEHSSVLWYSSDPGQMNPHLTFVRVIVTPEEN